MFAKAEIISKLLSHSLDPANHNSSEHNAELKYEFKSYINVMNFKKIKLLFNIYFFYIYKNQYELSVIIHTT